jgi:hypothetical protein
MMMTRLQQGLQLTFNQSSTGAPLYCTVLYAKVGLLPPRAPDVADWGRKGPGDLSAIKGNGPVFLTDGGSNVETGLHRDAT